MNGWSSMFDAIPAEHPLDPSSSRAHSGGILGPRPTYQTQSRPSLSRLTDVVEKEVAEAAASHRGSPLADGPTNQDVKGKGRAIDMIEVIAHKVTSTDSVMAVALKYGIEVGTLRKANKLWSSDSIHLRTELLVPLDACLRDNVIRGPEAGQATIVPRGHYRQKDRVTAPPLIRLDSDPPPPDHPPGEIVFIKKVLSTSLQAGGKQTIPRKSAESTRPAVRRSTSINHLNQSAGSEARVSTSSSRPSLDLGWDSRPVSRTSIDAESEASIELRPRNVSTPQQSRSRPPRNLWFSVADDGIDPGQGLY